jgi:hypothetical protein
MIVLYCPLKCAFKARPGIARGWTPTLDNVAQFPSPTAALESLAPHERDRWEVLRVNLERVPEDELLLS